MISVRWRPSSWMQFSSLFFKIVHDTGQQLAIDRTNFLTDSFLQIIQRTGFVSVNTRFQIPPKKKKSHVERSGERGGHGTSPKREMRCPGSMFRKMVTRLRCALWHHLVETTHWHSLFFFGAVLSTTHSKDIRFPWVTLYLISCIHLYWCLPQDGDLSVQHVGGFMFMDIWNFLQFVRVCWWIYYVTESTLPGMNNVKYSR